MYDSVGFGIFTELCNQHHDLISKLFHYPRQKPHTHWHHTLHHPPSVPRNSCFFCPCGFTYSECFPTLYLKCYKDNFKFRILTSSEEYLSLLLEGDWQFHINLIQS